MIYDQQHCDFVYSIYLKPKRCETNSHFHITSNSYKITKSFVKEKTPYILAACIHLTIDFCLTTYQPIYFSYRTAVRSEANARHNICVFMVFWFHSQQSRGQHSQWQKSEEVKFFTGEISSDLYGLSGCDILNLTFCRLDFHQLLIKIS